jgi:hypothetical protein
VRYWLEYHGDNAAHLEDGGVSPLHCGDWVIVTEEPIWLYKADERGVPPGLRHRRRRLALADGTVTWGSYSGHCRIWADAAAVLVEDFGSDNGTLVFQRNELGVSHVRWLGFEDRATVRPGEWIQLGHCPFLVREEDC